MTEVAPHADLRERAEAGASDRELGEVYGVNERTILRWRKAEGIPSGWTQRTKPMVHGTRFGYYRGCREACCKAAYAEHALALRRERFKLTAANGGIAPVPQHNVSTAGNWGCRCEVCIAAVHKRNVEYKSALSSRVSQ